MSIDDKPSEWWVYAGAKGPVVFMQELSTSGVPGTRVIEHSAYAEAIGERDSAEECAVGSAMLLASANAKLESAEEGRQFYKREWESACERAQYAKELQDQVAALEADNKRLGAEIEDLMHVDYWQDRHNIEKAVRTALEARAQGLAAALRQMKCAMWCENIDQQNIAYEAAADALKEFEKP